MLSFDLSWWEDCKYIWVRWVCNCSFRDSDAFVSPSGFWVELSSCSWKPNASESRKLQLQTPRTHIYLQSSHQDKSNDNNISAKKALLKKFIFLKSEDHFSPEYQGEYWSKWFDLPVPVRGIPWLLENTPTPPLRVSYKKLRTSKYWKTSVFQNLSRFQRHITDHLGAGTAKSRRILQILSVDCKESPLTALKQVGDHLKNSPKHGAEACGENWCHWPNS